MKLGLKIWSTNANYIKPAQELFSRGVYDYIELYTVKHSSAEHLAQWTNLDIPYILHAPHSYGGFNASLPECKEENRRILKDVEVYRRTLNPQFIILHPGISGTAEETIRQMNDFRKESPELFSKALMENKPMWGMKGEKCVGDTPEEMKKILDATGMGFCLDFGHAIKYAIAAGKDHRTVLDAFQVFSPSVYHLSDGQMDNTQDQHLRLGEGEFDLSDLLSRVPESGMVSLETEKDSKDNLYSSAQDFQKIRELSPPTP